MGPWSYQERFRVSFASLLKTNFSFDYIYPVLLYFFAYFPWNYVKLHISHSYLVFYRNRLQSETKWPARYQPCYPNIYCIHVKTDKTCTWRLFCYPFAEESPRIIKQLICNENICQLEDNQTIINIHITKKWEIC